MTLYYFDSIEPNQTFTDDVGTECANFAEMRAITLRTICDIAAEACWQTASPQYGIIVRDVDNREIYAVSLSLIERTKLAA